MDEKDQKIRKQWFGLFLFNACHSLIYMILHVKFDAVMNTPLFPMQIFLIVYGIMLMGMNYLIYHCIYKKPGTKLLTFCLVASVISLIGSPVAYLLGKVPAPSFIPYYGIYLTILEGIGIWGLSLLWKMRKINQKLQKLPSTP